MPVRLHWFLPTNGDSHTDLSLGNAVGAHGARIDDAATNARKGDLGYMSQVARAAEAMGFEAALTPTSSWCEDAWVITAALTQLTRTSSTWSPSGPACSRRPWRRRRRRPTSASPATGCC